MTGLLGTTTKGHANVRAATEHGSKGEHQRRDEGVHRYLTEQPGFDKARLAEIFEAFPADHDRAERDLKRAQEALTKLLKDYEGRPH